LAEQTRKICGNLKEKEQHMKKGKKITWRRSRKETQEREEKKIGMRDAWICRRRTKTILSRYRGYRDIRK
jgi:hypothetical protein